MELNKKAPVVYFGRLIDSKGVKITIKACHSILSAHPAAVCPLWIIGGNHQEIAQLRQSEDIKSVVVTLEDQNLLFWWGHLPHEILPFILQKCALFCFTSKYEPGGRTILEAMASKLPVLATPQGFAGEVVANGVNGYLINSEDPEVWAEYIYTIVSDADHRKKLSIAAFETVQIKYSMNAFFEKHWEMYEQAIQEYDKHSRTD